MADTAPLLKAAEGDEEQANGIAHHEEESPTCCCCAASSLPWRLLHAFAFLLGGTTFIAGTLLLFYPNNDTLSALLYTIGSFGFLTVDGQELCTFEGTVLRLNIFMSFIGSFLYVVGSVGFFPQLGLPEMGVWGFIIGSAVIGVSQFWKTYRLGSIEGKGFSLSKALGDCDAAAAIGVEFCAGLGAWCFFFGTIMYEQGSMGFTLGGMFVALRHFVMGAV